MKFKSLAALILSSQAAFAGGSVFDVQSSNEGLSVPVVLCLDGLAQMTCYKHTVIGHDIYVRTTTRRNTNFPNAGIKASIGGYQFTGCTPNGNGYCIFAANSFGQVHIGLK